jgi:hypothetical protein
MECKTHLALTAACRETRGTWPGAGRGQPDPYPVHAADDLAWFMAVSCSAWRLRGQARVNEPFVVQAAATPNFSNRPGRRNPARRSHPDGRAKAANESPMSPSAGRNPVFTGQFTCVPSTSTSSLGPRTAEERASVGPWGASPPRDPPHGGIISPPLRRKPKRPWRNTARAILSGWSRRGVAAPPAAVGVSPGAPPLLRPTRDRGPTASYGRCGGRSTWVTSHLVQIQQDLEVPGQGGRVARDMTTRVGAAARIPASTSGAGRP